MEHRDGNNSFNQGGGDIENDGSGSMFERRESNVSTFSDRDGAVREPLLNLRSRVNTTSQIAIVGAKVYPIESLDYEYGFSFHLPDSRLFLTRLFIQI